MGRARLRDLGITIGHLPTGPHNAITDVPSVQVGHRTLISDTPRIVRTGVTMVVPRGGGIWEDYAFAGVHSFNGCGEMTGVAWIEESGMLETPIGITNTHAVGVVRDALVAYGVEHGHVPRFTLPVVAETFDGWLNDINAFTVTQAAALEALSAAAGGAVAEGSVGGGTGMRCHGFKGGIGTSSRVVTVAGGAFTIGALVQANYGAMRHLRIDGAPVGRELAPRWETAEPAAPPAGSIIAIVATDAPLVAGQCRRLAQRATVGLARVGGLGHNSSGDLFLAFATGNHLPADVPAVHEIRMLPNAHLDLFFEGVADAVEESILNALVAAETMRGFRGTLHALPLDEVRAVMKRHRPRATADGGA
ncbi:MAG TPA: P1 family peptidase [bacterium]|nr:P1 family peptidase [bacterium]